MDIPSTQEHHESAEETAKIICECVNNLLTDLKTVELQLKNDTSGNPQSQVVLQFLYHCVVAFPECYIYKPIPEEATDESLMQKYEDSKSFSCWIMTRLFRIISYPGCRCLHEKSSSVVVSILQLIEEKDLCFYNEVVNEMVGLFEDVLNLSEEYMESNEDQSIFNAELFSARFQPLKENGDAHALLNIKLLELSSYLNCQLLLIYICNILSKILHSIKQYIAPEVPKIFSLVYRTIHLNDLNIVPHAVSCLGSIIENITNDMPEYYIASYVNVVTACIDYILFQAGNDEFDKVLMEKVVQKAVLQLLKHKHIRCATYRKFFDDILTFLFQLDGSTEIEEFLLEFMASSMTEHQHFFNEDYDLQLVVQFVIQRIKKRRFTKKIKKEITRIVVASAKKFTIEHKQDVIGHIVQIKNAIIGSSYIKDREDVLENFYYHLKVLLIICEKQQIKDVIEQLEVNLLTQNILSLLTMKKKIQLSPTMLVRIYDYIVILLKLFIHVSFVEKTSVQKFLEVASIPWFHTIDPPWFDFRATFCNESDLKQLNKHIMTATKNKTIVKRSIKIMSLLGTYSKSHTWISHALRYSLSNTSDIDQQMESLKRAPFYLHCLKENGLNILNEELVGLVRTGSDKCKQLAGQIIKDIICSTDQTTEITIINGKITLKCKLRQDNTSSTKRNNNIASYLKLFFQAIKMSSSKELKLNFLHALTVYINHIDPTEYGSSSNMNVWNVVMEMMKDGSYEVRFLLSQTIGILVEKVALHDVQQQLVSNLSEIFSQASELSDASMLETLALTMGSIGCKAKDEFLSLMVVSLFNCYVTQSKNVAAIAHTQIHRISKAKEMSCKQLFIQHKYQLCEIAVKKFLKILEDGGEVPMVKHSFYSISRLFEFPDVKQFLQISATEMLPKIVQKASAKSSVVLRLFAKYSAQNRREMMFYNFKYIFSYLVRTVTRESELEHCLRYLQDETDVELSSLLISECQSVFNQLILYLSVNKEQVIQGFSILACNDPSFKGNADFKSEEEVALFLHQKLLGILAFFNSVFINSPLFEKKLALKSISSMLNLMGPKYITPVRLKIMAILKLALKFKDQFAELCCSAWHVFVHNIETESLGPMLGPIVATILPLLDSCPDQVAALCNFLSTDNRNALSVYYRDIYYIPDHPSLAKIKKFVDHNYPTARSLKEFKSQISSVVKGISHENKDVQKFALTRLSKLFEENHNLVYEMMDNDDTIDICLIEVLSELMSCSNARGKETCELIGKCFGQLGAIDSGKIETLSKQFDNENISCHTTVESVEFAFDFINDLCRAFLAASSTIAQDCAAFAIQETLQVYQCSNEHPEGIGYRLWRRFPSQTKELLEPHLHSKYVNAAVYNWSKLSLPIYGGQKSSTYKGWVCHWTNYLTYSLDEETVSKIFKPCMSIVKHDLKIGLFILPYVVLSTISSGKSDLVYKEVTAILKSVADSTNVSEFENSCVQTIFSILDFLQAWKTKQSSVISLVGDEKPNARLAKLTKFLESIPKDLLAKSSLSCNAHARCLMYHEQFISQSRSDSIEEHLEFLQKIYFCLDEPDGIVGVAATRIGTTSLKQQIVEHESSGKLRDAVACYERAIQTEPDDIKHYKGMLEGLIGLGQLNNALMGVAGVIEKRCEWENDLKPYQAEIAWRLGQWDILKDSVKNNDIQEDWSLSLGKLLLSLKERDHDSFSSTLSKVRCSQTEFLLSSGLDSGGYHKAYKSILRLHMLEDLEQCSKYIVSNIERPPKKFVSEIQQRLDLTEATFKSRESILNLRRTMLLLWPNQDQLIAEQDHGWLMTTRIARKDGLFQTAYSSLLNVVNVQQADILIEKAKWFECQQDLHKALLNLQKGVEPSGSFHKRGEETVNLAKISLLKAKWMEETEYYEPEPVLAQYKEAVSKNPQWEKGHFCLAKYYEKLMNALDEKDDVASKKIKRNEFIKFVIKHYGMSLQFGSKYIYQSLPRLLTLWLDFGLLAQQVLDGQYDSKPSDKSYFKDKMLKLNDDIMRLSQALPAYQFLTAFSQLVSRICHPNFSVWKILKGIICKIFSSYSQQAIWSLVAVSKSSFPTRSERCKDIFQQTFEKQPTFRKFTSDCLNLADCLLDVSNRRCGKETKLYMNKDFPQLVNMLNSQSFSNIMVPLQRTLTVKLPSKNVTGSDQQYNPFMDSLPMIIGVENTVDVLSSLQKPKKIAVKASDGRSYTLMCKPKDDLRKDNRLMEFNGLVNRLLLRDPDCRRRQLHIRTYAVIPLNEECGLLEWVSNTTGFRYILNKIYKERGIIMKVSELKQLYDAMRNVPLKSKVEMFNNRVLPRFPPVFHEWFLINFSNPKKWYTARLAYCRTAAVMSMVGYVLGLGDRHGENILFDSMSGDCVHVDFNCLFNKGETFDCPERVPFRLTHNMIKAMGPLEYEGIFRKSCEMTMQLMRNQRDSFLSVLNTFLYDPLVEWKKETRKKASGETTNDMAVKILRKVEQRLKGYINSTMIHLPLSIEGQVHQLIRESTDMENLAQMYIGWAAYM